MNPSLAARAARSCEAMEYAIELIAQRFNADPSALGRGVRRELGRVSLGIVEVRRLLQHEVSQILAGVAETTPAEKRALDRLAELLSNKANNARPWAEFGDLLAAEGFDDGRGLPFKRDRLILLAMAAAGAPRYALGEPAFDDCEASDVGEAEIVPAQPNDPDANDATSARLFDLLNLPRAVGGRGGLAPIVRACFAGTTRYGMKWRFATAHDSLIVPIVDDDVDADPDDAENDEQEHDNEEQDEP